MPTIAEAFAHAQRLQQAGNLAQAEAIYRQILAAEPSHADALHFIGVIALQVGKPDAALQCISESIRMRPSHHAFHSNLAMVYMSMGRWEQAADACRTAITLRPDIPDVHSGLGNALLEQGKSDEAITSYRKALQLNPQSAEAHANLAAALQRQGNLKEAEAECRLALRIAPESAPARNTQGVIRRSLGRLDEALTDFRKAIQSNPSYALAHNNMAITLQLLGRTEEAAESYEKALVLDPKDAGTRSNLAVLLQHIGRLDEAETHARHAVRLQPGFPNALLNLGGILQLEGKLAEALATFRAAEAQAPNDPNISSNILLCMNYDPRIDSQTLFAEHRAWGERCGRQTPWGPLPNHDRSPERRLRIGYISPDLRTHPLAQFFEPVLANHDPAQVEVTCYSEVAAPDATTARLKSLAHRWRATDGVADAALAEQIRNDGIDILVDLAGHTAKNRLRVFSRKPAPITATYLGYPFTTGLDSIDYRFTDAVADPPGESSGYTEELVRLPHAFACFQPPENAPAVGPLPAAAAGFVTFGSLHNLARLNPEVIALWCELLHAVPNSRLFIFRDSLRGKVKDALLASIISRGIPADRVRLEHTVGDGGYLGVYDAIDISLDTFPWSGHTTACQSLWMGVPVITLRGQRHAGRMVASVLENAGLGRLIADTPQEYTAIAMELASDLPGLAALRGGLREQMRQSPVCDGPGFTRSLQAAYRKMWQRWRAR